MNTTTEKSQLQSVAGFRSETSFDAIRYVISEVESENSRSLAGEKEFCSNEQFNMFVQRHLRLGDTTLTHEHWNRLVFYAAGEIQAEPDGRYSLQAIQQSPYGSAVLFLLLILIRSYGVGYATRIMHSSCRSLQIQHSEHDMAHAASFYLLSTDVQLRDGEGTESVPSVVLRKLMSPASTMMAIKLGIRCYIRNTVRSMYHTESFNPLNLNSIDANVDLYSTDNCVDYKLGSVYDQLQAEYLIELINSTDGFTDEEISFLQFWRSSEGQSVCCSGKNLRAQLRLLATHFGITERRSRTLYSHIIRKYRAKLGLSVNQRSIVLRDFKDKSVRSKVRNGLRNAQRTIKGGTVASIVEMPRVIDEISSHYVDYDDGQLLRQIAGTGDNIFATVKERMKPV